MNTPILRIESVSKRYAAHLALDNVSLDVPGQTIFGLLGPNGAGKTSLIRIINQITAPDSGRVYLNGEPLNPSHISRIGYLPEERGLYKKMEVAEQALYFARLRGLGEKEAKSRINYWFDKLELGAWKRKKIEELSKGMAQKVQFIITVLHEPSLIILDEPFTGFDPINAEIIKNELLHMREKGATIILSTHRMETVESLCTHIALINRSKKVIDGEVRTIKQQFKTHRFEAEFRGSLNHMPADIEEDSRESIADNMHRSVFRLKDNPNPNYLLQSLIAAGAEVHYFSELIPSINDIFIQLVKEK